MSKQYQVGGFDLFFPNDHKLEQYQSVWRLYDRALGIITQSVFTKYPQLTAIDIGANIGDTAALIQEHQPVPTLCIEGNPEYFEYLEQNASIIGNVEIADCFIGQAGEIVNYELIASQGGTTSIVNAIGSEGILTAQMQTLEFILNEFPQFAQSKLLKIDTDGFDFEIIKQSQDVIERLKPVLYFEYDISFKENAFTEGLSAIDQLIESGYSKFMIYDNFGNYMISLSAQDGQNFREITNYLISNLYKSGQPAIYYLDICAFSDEDIDVFNLVHAQFMSIKPTMNSGT